METIYRVPLKFEFEGTGGGSMMLTLAVNPQDGTLGAMADGTVLEGTEHPNSFVASALGKLHSTGIPPVTKVGSVIGQAMVSFQPAVGTYLAPFLASFAVDNEWNGTGSFSVGTYTYACKVTNAD